MDTIYIYKIPVNDTDTFKLINWKGQINHLFNHYQINYLKKNYENDSLNIFEGNYYYITNTINKQLHTFLFYENIDDTYDITYESRYPSNKNPEKSGCTIAFKKSKVKVKSSKDKVKVKKSKAKKSKVKANKSKVKKSKVKVNSSKKDK